jgi:hypothetical protein
MPQQGQGLAERARQPSATKSPAQEISHSPIFKLIAYQQLAKDSMERQVRSREGNSWKHNPISTGSSAMGLA